MRGEWVEIDEGRRRLRAVREGPADARPTVLLEAGAFGFSADWGVVQDKLATLGRRSLAYDRAGLGLSDPGPTPRDGKAVAADLQRLLSALGEDGPFVLVGHSMAGLYLRLHAARMPDRILGLVLVDAVTPEASVRPEVRRFIAGFSESSQIAALSAQLGLFRPLAGTWFGDKISLTPAASKEKRRAFASGRHNRTAAAEVREWLRTAEQAEAAGPFDPAWPVAVISADHGYRRVGDGTLQAEPALRARRGWAETAPGSGHASLLGVHHADHVVRAIEKVIAAA